MIAYFPMGQGPVPKRTYSESKVIDDLKKEWSLRRVPSFELWCACTCYDPSQAHGGKVFQTMMGWALTHGAAESNFKINTTDFYKAKRRSTVAKPGPRSDYDYGSKSGEINYAPATQTKIKRDGGGANMAKVSGTRGFQGPNAAASNNWVSGTGFAPVGRLAWWETTGLTAAQQGVDKCESPKF